MEFASVENHDDFYTLDCSIDKSGVRGTGITALWKSAITAASITSPHPDLNIPHVQDFRGFYIVYDAALNDLEKLDDELILMGSYYIEKDVGKPLNDIIFIKNKIIQLQVSLVYAFILIQKTLKNNISHFLFSFKNSILKKNFFVVSNSRHYQNN